VRTRNATLHEDSDEESNIGDVEASLSLGEEAEAVDIDVQSGSEDENEEKIDENGVSDDIKRHLKQLEWREIAMGQVDSGQSRSGSYERRSHPTFRPGKHIGPKNTEGVCDGDSVVFFIYF